MEKESTHAESKAKPVRSLVVLASLTVELGDAVASVVRMRGGSEREAAAAGRERRLRRRRLWEEIRAAIGLGFHTGTSFASLRE